MIALVPGRQVKPEAHRPNETIQHARLYHRRLEAPRPHGFVVLVVLLAPAAHLALADLRVEHPLADAGDAFAVCAFDVLLVAGQVIHQDHHAQRVGGRVVVIFAAVFDAALARSAAHAALAVVRARPTAVRVLDRKMKIGAPARGIEIALIACHTVHGNKKLKRLDLIAVLYANVVAVPPGHDAPGFRNVVAHQPISALVLRAQPELGGIAGHVQVSLIAEQFVGFQEFAGQKRAAAVLLVHVPGVRGLHGIPRLEVKFRRVHNLRRAPSAPRASHLKLGPAVEASAHGVLGVHDELRVEREDVEQFRARLAVGQRHVRDVQIVNKSTEGIVDGGSGRAPSRFG